MVIKLKDDTKAMITRYRDYTRIVFTGIDKTIQVEPDTELTIDRLELLKIALMV